MFSKSPSVEMPKIEKKEPPTSDNNFSEIRELARLYKQNVINEAEKLFKDLDKDVKFKLAELKVDSGESVIVQMREAKGPGPAIQKALGKKLDDFQYLRFKNSCLRDFLAIIDDTRLSDSERLDKLFKQVDTDKLMVGQKRSVLKWPWEPTKGESFIKKVSELLEKKAAIMGDPRNKLARLD